MKLVRLILAVLTILLASKSTIAQKQQPNILWMLTDDERYDAVRSFNKILTGQEMSELGYVESPNVDNLVSQGTTYINTYCQATGCAPSRSAMHLGRYPFRSGVYEFEYYNNNAEHCKPTLPEQMADLGYQTIIIGKQGVRIKTINNQGKSVPFEMYQTNISFKQLRRDGLTDWGKDWFYEMDGEKLEKPMKQVKFFVTPEGEFEYVHKELEVNNSKHKGTAKKTMKKYDLLRHYTPQKPNNNIDGIILSGVSSQPAGKTRDGHYASIFEDYLKNENKKFAAGSRVFEGVDTSKPLFCNIGFDYPHTPVLPPASYRERFAKKKYKVPEFNKKELENMPSQLKKIAIKSMSDHFTDEEKQKMIQDYYAFCAYGDELVGQAAKAFIEYSEKNNQDWIIMFVCGDHGWKLNDHGAISKFSSWEIDSHNPIVVVSSDKKTFPAGKVVQDYTEFIDIAPTFMAAGGANLKDKQYEYLDGMDMAQIASGKAQKRDYIIGESHAVTGPRAYIRTKEYVFSMQTRPHKKRGENMEWALNASYKELDPALYDMTKDPKETKNLAFDKNYEEIAMKMKKKLMDIVLGDDRVEVGWGKKADGTTVYRSNFAPGAHDYKLKL